MSLSRDDKSPLFMMRSRLMLSSCMNDFEKCRRKQKSVLKEEKRGCYGLVASSYTFAGDLMRQECWSCNEQVKSGGARSRLPGSCRLKEPAIYSETTVKFPFSPSISSRSLEIFKCSLPCVIATSFRSTTRFSSPGTASNLLSSPS